MITKENAGDTLLEHRDKYKLTQLDVSKKIGISVQAVCLIEGGNNKPQSMSFKKIKKYLSTFKPVDN